MKKLMILLAAMAVAAGVAVAAGLDSQSYVQSGLVTQFDAIDNVGTGTQDPSATRWVDLKGSSYIDLQSGASWTDRYLDTSPAQHTIKTMPAYNRASLTIETTVNIMSNGLKSGQTDCYPRIFSHGESCTVHFQKSGTMAQFYMAGIIPGSDIRPKIDSLRGGTVVAYSGSAHFGLALDGLVVDERLYPPTGSLEKPAGDWTLNGHSGYLHGHYYAFRYYNRELTRVEIVTNATVDKLRFFSHRWNGAGATEDWSSIAWTVPEKASGTSPSTLTNESATIVNATVNVAAADGVALAALSLEDGATLNVAADAEMVVKALYVEGVAIRHGIYTGTGPVGTQASWLSGDGLVRVAGRLDFGIPYLVPTPAADGWYEFGVGTYSQSEDATYDGTTRHYAVAQWCRWQDYTFPEGAKLRLKGGVIVDTIPVGWFSEVDQTGIKQITAREQTVFEDGTAVTVPSGAQMRYSPGEWLYSGSGNKHWNTSVMSKPFLNDLVVNGTLLVHGNGTRYSHQVFEGSISGTGTISLDNFCNYARFEGPRFAFAGNAKYPSDLGGTFTVLSPAVEGTMGTFTMHGCTEKWKTNNSYCATGLLFGPKKGSPTAQGELRVKNITKGDSLEAQVFLTTSGTLRRSGGTVLVWGSNTVHAAKVSTSLHVLARGGDQNCGGGGFNDSTVPKFGTGNFIVDELANGSNLFPGTNVYVKVGTVVGASTIDYSPIKNAINGMTLDITNTCNSGAIVKATDIGMLPARLSGFAGTVQLTDTATKSYTMPIDFTHGTNTLYNKVGCIGSGTLGSAPASGTIDVTFPTTGETPVKGEYALARFASGGSLLANWTVTLNGQATSTAAVRGMSIEVVKDDTGLWLNVHRPGITVIIR